MTLDAVSPHTTGMQRATPINADSTARLEPLALLQLLKPVTWFPPMWAFLCGAVSSTVSLSENLWLVLAGLILAGPLVCGASQIINDWFDREVDAINEPNRPIPSGRAPGNSARHFAIIWCLLALVWSGLLGTWVFLATLVGLFMAWAYSAPPLRFKQNGWLGNAAVGISYEGLAWVTGAAVMLGGTLPAGPILLLAALYSIGAHGIMTLNDFKALEGDLKLGIQSLPAQLGPERAARLSCVVMTLPQLGAIALLVYFDRTTYAAIVGALVVGQFIAMARMLKDPRQYAPWYNGTGVTLYVLGMLVCALAAPFDSGVAI
ncbi:chlorophyll synthase ChlG [Luminiphilus syltensis]|uniref:chlorophyll synthase ChlG n=1 Tax=Luminiphilus syltensis TaxID=1341119 RepID=UPI001E55E09D|nr:chlorophyll synthase ChlG [Luminiphilus syltensis]